MKNKILIIGVILLLMLGSFAGIMYYNSIVEVPVNKPNNDEPNNDSSGIVKDDEKDKTDILNDHNRFYTIEECINKFYMYVSSSNNAAAIALLDEKYKDENNIIYENIFDYFSSMKEYNLFNAKSIKVEKISDNIIKYKVTGTVSKEDFSGVIDKKEVKYTVFFDQSNMTFSLALTSDYKNNITSIVSNEYNKYFIRNISDRHLAEIYFSDFRSKVITNDKSLKDILGNNTMAKEDIYEASIKIYTVTKNKDGYLITITDNLNNKYKFDIKGIFDYNVQIV